MRRYLTAGMEVADVRIRKGGLLSQLEIRFFRDAGYLRMNNVIEAALTAELLDVSQRLFMEETPASGKVYQAYQKSPAIRALVERQELLSPLESILGPNIVLVLNRHNQITMNRPGEFAPRLHRDVLQWTRNLVTVLVFLEDATPETGCTHLVPGSHLLPFVGVPQLDGGGTWMDEHVEYAGLEEQAVPVPVAAGGILIFDSLAFHSVGRNVTNRSRSSITLGFRSVDELDRPDGNQNQVVVAGEQIYRGNDTHRVVR